LAKIIARVFTAMPTDVSITSYCVCLLCFNDLNHFCARQRIR